MNAYDQKALKILLNYDPLNPQHTSSEDFEYAKKHGVLFDRIEISHDALIQSSVENFNKTKKADVADAFITGLGQNNPFLRSAFSAYAVLSNFTKHEYTKRNLESENCSICGERMNMKIDLSFINRCRRSGSIVANSIKDCNYYLALFGTEQANKTPSDYDIDKFCEMLDFIKNCPADEKPLTLVKKIRKVPGIKMTVEQARHFLDSLGYGGILQTTKHIGFIYKYHGYLTPSSSRSSDWAYPVDFWRGSDGINKDALIYWFSHHKKIIDHHNL